VPGDLSGLGMILNARERLNVTSVVISAAE